mmetsp:Transcript_143756/g.253945  ORF Transcript_143756/g.253945 Transcript_143756/m.253945 type:complete len:769 (-) Transcript_143756:71-2377(-)
MSALEGMRKSVCNRWPRAEVQATWPSAASSTSRASSSTSPPGLSLAVTSPAAESAHERLTRRAASLQDTLKRLKSKRRKKPHKVAGDVDALAVSLLSGCSTPEAIAPETSLHMSAVSSLSATELGYSRSPAQIAQPRRSVRRGSLEARASVTPEPRLRAAMPWTIETPSPSWQLSPSEHSCTSPAAPRNKLIEARDSMSLPSPPAVLAAAREPTNPLKPLDYAWTPPAPPVADLSMSATVESLGDGKIERTPLQRRSMSGLDNDRPGSHEAIGHLREELKDERIKWADEFSTMQGAMRGTVEDLTCELRAAHAQWNNQLTSAQGSESRMANLLEQCSQISTSLRRSQESWCKQVNSAYEEARTAIDACSRLSSQMDEARRTMSSEMCAELDEARCAMTKSEAECAELKVEVAAAAARPEKTQRRRSGRLESTRSRGRSSTQGTQGDATQAMERDLAKRLTELDSRQAKNHVMIGMLEASVGKGMASAQKAEAFAAEEMRILEEELKQHLRESLGAESRWREEATVARGEVESLRQTLAKLECGQKCPPAQNQNTDGWEFDDLPEFMRQVAFAVAHFKRYQFKLQLTGARNNHKARLLWEEWYWREHEYWEGSSQRDFPFADLRSQDLTKVSREAQEAYYAVLLKVGSGASDGATIRQSAHGDEVNHQASTFVKALARALHRFLRMPGAQDAGLAWIKTAVREAGILAGAEESSQGGGAFGSGAEDAELQDVMARAEMAMRLPPAQFLRRIREGFTPLSPLLASSERFL